MGNAILREYEKLAAARPRAVLVAGRRRSATVSDIDALARAIDRVLGPRPPTPGVAVALAAADGAAFLAGLIAVWRRECAALLLDLSSPPAERERIAGALGAAGILECANPWPRESADWGYSGARGAGEPAAVPGAAVIKLTSGSTGAPRGIIASAETLISDDEQLFLTMGLTSSDRLLSAVPMGHSYGLSSLAIPALRKGVTVVLPAPHEDGFFASLLAAEDCAATFVPTTPAWLHSFLRVEDRPRWPSSVRLTISAGAMLAPQTAERFRRFAAQPVHTFYGSSECGGICFDRDGGAAERGAVGAPVEGVRVSLLPLNGGSEERHGQVEVRSAAVAESYWPTSDAALGGGRFLAGDVATWRQGELVLLGRIDDLLNVRGKKFSPREVEATLRDIPGVDEVAVVGLPDSGAGGHLVRAVLVGDPRALSVEQVLAHCRETLAAHKIPRSVIVLRELPRTSRGKLDRAILLDPALGTAREEST